MKVAYLVLFFAIALANVAAYQGIGDRLLRTFFIFHALPLNTTDAESSGWEPVDGSCNEFLGVRYTQNSGPIFLYFTSGGQIAGVGVVVSDAPPPSLVPDFWKPVNGSGSHEVTLSFRQTGMMCSGEQAAEVIGDVLVINPDAANLQIGFDVDEATQLQWTPGHCISKMGTHWAYDIDSHPDISHKVANLVPVMPMYNDQTGNLSAFLIHINHIESVEPFGVWEGPFPPILFCDNLCSPCTFDTFFFSTIHFMLTDPDLNICGSSCGSSILA